MLTDIRKLCDQLPLDAQAVALAVFDCDTPRAISEENRSSLALAAGLRHVVESGGVHEMILRALAIGHRPSFVRLLGFCDAYSRRIVASMLASHEECNRALGIACGIRSLSNSRRCSNIWGVAISYAERI